MPTVQRHLTAIAALGLLLVAVACSSADRTEVALTGADGSAADPSSTAVTSPTPTIAPSSEPGATSVVTDDPATYVAPDADAVTTSPVAAASEANAATTTAVDPDARKLDAVEDAVERGDLCGVYAGLAGFDLSTTSTDRLIAQLTRIRDFMVRSSTFVGATLAADWTTVTDGTTDMLDSLERDRAIEQNSAATHFDDEQYRAASQRVGDWMDRNCA